MLSSTSLVSKAAAARILSIPAAVIARVKEWARVALVVFRKGLGLRPRFVSLSQFRNDATTLRIENACKLPGTVIDLGAKIFQVVGSTGTFYTVDLAFEHCDCDDHKYRGSRTRCKHLRLAAAASAAHATLRLVQDLSDSEAIALGESAALSLGW